MPKPIIVIQSGDIPRERFEMSRDFMLTSNITAHIREEYHILMIHTAPETSYILSAENTTVILDPSPTTVAKLIKALEKAKDESDTEVYRERVKAYKNEMWAAKMPEGKPISKVIIDRKVIDEVFAKAKSSDEPPNVSAKVKQALKDMHAIRDAARQHISEIKSILTDQEIAEWFNVPDIKIGANNQHITNTSKNEWPQIDVIMDVFGINIRRSTVEQLQAFSKADARIRCHVNKAGELIILTATTGLNNIIKDPDEMQSFFGYKIRRSTMYELESIITADGQASFKVSSDGELLITREL